MLDNMQRLAKLSFKLLSEYALMFLLICETGFNKVGNLWIKSNFLGNRIGQ